MRTKGLSLALLVVIILIASGLFAGGPTPTEVINQETTGSEFGPLFPTNKPRTLVSGEVGGQMQQGGHLELGQKVTLNYPLTERVAVIIGTALFQNSHSASSEKDRGMWSGFAGLRLSFEDPAIEVGATWNIRYQFKTGDMFRHLTLRVNLGNGRPESWSLENVFEIAPQMNGNQGIFKETLRLRRVSEPLLFGFWGKRGPSAYFGGIFQYETNQTPVNQMTTEIEFGLLFGLLSSSDPFDIGVHFGLFTPDKGGASFTGGITLGLSLNN